MADDLFSALEEGSFDGITVPVVSVDIATGSAAAFHKYPYRPGVDVEYTGREPTSGTILAAFFNDIDAPSSNVLWPDTLFTLRQRVQEQRSGPLVIPTLGTLPKAMITLREHYDSTHKDGCFATIAFVEDSRDKFAQNALGTPSAAGRLPAAALAADNALAAMKLQAFDGSTIDGATSFLDAINNLQGQITRIQDDAARPLQLASAIAAKVDELLGTVSALRHPDNWPAAAALRDLKDNVHQTIDDAKGARQIVIFRVGAPTSAAAVATATKNSVTDVIALNALPDPNDIDAGTTMYVYGT